MSRSTASLRVRTVFLALALSLSTDGLAAPPAKAEATAPLTGPVTLTLKPATGLSYEKLIRGKFKTVVVNPQKVLTKVIETGMREAGRVMDTSGGEVRIASRAAKSVLKVNGKAKKGGVPGASAQKVRVFNHRGSLLRSTALGVPPGDLREMAVKMPKGKLPAGTRWKQTFRLAAGAGTKPIPIEADFVLGAERTVIGRPGYELRGTLKLARQESPNKLLTVSGAGKLLVIVDRKTGMPLFKSMRMHVEEVREDEISRAYVKAGGKKLGFYIDLAQQEKTEFLAKKRPPSLRSKTKPGAKPAKSLPATRGASAPLTGLPPVVPKTAPRK